MLLPYYNKHFFNNTWTGDTHKETDVVTFSFLLAPLSPSSLPRHSSLDSQGLLHTLSSLSLPRPAPSLSSPSSGSLHLALYANTFPPCPLPVLPPTLLNTESLRSMDLPWISPGSPLLLTDTCLRVFPCFFSFASLVSPSSP